MLGEFSVHCGGFDKEQSISVRLRVDLILACQEVLKCVWPSMNRNRLVFIQSRTLPPSIHTGGKKVLVLCLKQPMRNHTGPTPDGKSHLIEG
jgi:hypothetical protein